MKKFMFLQEMEGVEVPTKQEFELAQGELISFLSKYSNMLVDHLNEIREVMSITTEQVMDGVSKISEARDSKKKMTESAHSGSEDEKLCAETQEASMNKLKQHINSFENLDYRIEEMLFKIMGSLSTDDVVGQRMEHINKALMLMSKELADVIGEQSSEFNGDDVKELSSRLFSSMKQSYTMVDEHKVMDNVLYKLSLDKIA